MLDFTKPSLQLQNSLRLFVAADLAPFPGICQTIVDNLLNAVCHILHRHRICHSLHGNDFRLPGLLILLPHVFQKRLHLEQNLLQRLFIRVLYVFPQLPDGIQNPQRQVPFHSKLFQTV